MTQTIPCPATKADLTEASPYDLLGTHAMRYECEDLTKLKELLTSARASLPVMSKAFRANDVAGFCDAVASADLDLLRALAKADSLLRALRAM